MINYNDAAVALDYLLQTDEEAARTKVVYEALYEQRKTIRAVQFLDAKGSAAERTEKALASKEYQEHLSLLKDAQIEFEIIRNKRFTNQSIIEMWRSVNSNQKKGNV
jgi:DNA mismatch repair ATPase MutL